ncbi:hypothetical protein C8F01DRAFT_495809 [Mycena amicta]|nr:hypothetical protein C8F01DRAFT_495809 [Mycena amicta]
MNPPVKDLLPHMTPILRNRNEKVQEVSISRIADHGDEFVPASEWMPICLESLACRLPGPSRQVMRIIFDYEPAWAGPILPANSSRFQTDSLLQYAFCSIRVFHGRSSSRRLLYAGNGGVSASLERPV